MMMNLGGGGTGGGDPLQPGTAPAKAKRRRNRMALVCAQCRALKAKCDQTKPACAACLRKGVPCEYVSRHTPKEEAAKARRPRGHTGSTLASLSQPSASRSPSAASPSVIAFNPNPALALVDADLMPTIQDWFLIFNYLAVDENLPLLVSIAAERILDNFFFESPALRLTLCTIAAHMQYPRLSARVCASYYSRAKKAILQSIPHPSVKTLKSLLLFSQFALASGQPVVGEPFFVKAVHMLQELKMDIDPDFSPWLTTANMSEYDKEERRIIFWNIYYSLKLVQITASQRTQITLSSSNMKFLQQHRVSNPAFLFTRFLPERTAHFNPSVICHLSGILDIMQQATIHYKAIPKSATEIVLPSACTILIRQLGNLENNSLRHMLASSRDATLGYVVSAVVSNNSHTPPITPVPHLTIDSSTLLPILSTTFLFNAAVCILHRPQLYLTAHLPITSPLLAFPESYQALNTALLQSVTAARTITSLNSALAHTMREDFDSVKYDPFTSFVLFEAAIVLWFATTKTPAYWFKLAGATPSPLFLTMGAEERRAIRGEVLDVLRALKELEDIMGSHAADDGLIPPVSASARVGGAPPSNMLSPMVTAVTAMIEEMQAAEQRILAPSSVTQPATAVEELLIGMKVMALDDPDDARGTSYVDEPYCYLGLLGVKCGSFRWHGALEPAWQRFWASCLNS